MIVEIAFSQDAVSSDAELDEEGYRGDEDRRMLATKTEVERETILYERKQKQNEKQQREAARQKMMAQSVFIRFFITWLMLFAFMFL